MDISDDEETQQPSTNAVNTAQLDHFAFNPGETQSNTAHTHETPPANTPHTQQQLHQFALNASNTVHTQEQSTEIAFNASETPKTITHTQTQ